MNRRRLMKFASIGILTLGTLAFRATPAAAAVLTGKFWYGDVTDNGSNSIEITGSNVTFDLTTKSAKYSVSLRYTDTTTRTTVSILASKFPVTRIEENLTYDQYSGQSNVSLT